MTRDVDVIVLGGGPAGCAAGLALAGGDPSLRVLVVEAGDYSQPRIGESIPPDTRALLAELELLDAFLAEGHEPCLGSASSWGDDALGYNDFLFNPQGNGWHLDRRRFDAFLAAAVDERGVELWTKTRFLEPVDCGNGEGPGRPVLRLKTADGEERDVRARFVIDATGCRCLYAHRRGGRRRRLDRLVCAAAFFELPEGSDFARLTLLEAVEYGWWYTALLPEGRIATALATSHELYKERRYDRPEVWLEALARTRHLACVLAACRPVPGSLGVTAAPSYLLEPLHGDDWLAVGDAASAYDPISSQGIYKALTDGLHGGRAVLAHLGGDRDALPAHAVRVAARFDEYTRQRAYFYDLERRFEDAPFWVERRGASEMDRA